MTNESPGISVIIPAYNRSGELTKTIKSVLTQTFKNFEIIVVDDGSDEDLYTIIESFKDQRICYLKQEHSNANVARNLGISKSRGEYIAMLDSDDLWLKSHLEECLNVLQKYKTDGLYGSLMFKNQSGKEQVFTVRKLQPKETMIDYLLATGYGAQTSTLFMTSDSARKVKWDESLKRHQDYDFVVRYSKNFTLSVKKNPTVIYNTVRTKAPKIDFESCIRFIKDNENDISPLIYIRYNRSMLSFAKKQYASSDIIEHYIQEITYYKEYISFVDFLSYFPPKNKIQFFQLKIKFILHLFLIKIE